MDQLTEARGPLFSPDDILEQRFLVFDVFRIEWLYDAWEDELGGTMESAIWVIYRPWSRLLFQEWFLAKVGVRGEAGRF